MNIIRNKVVNLRNYKIFLKFFKNDEIQSRFVKEMAKAFFKKISNDEALIRSLKTSLENTFKVTEPGQLSQDQKINNIFIYTILAYSVFKDLTQNNNIIDNDSKKDDL